VYFVFVCSALQPWPGKFSLLTAWPRFTLCREEEKNVRFIVSTYFSHSTRPIVNCSKVSAGTSEFFFVAIGKLRAVHCALTGCKNSINWFQMWGKLWFFFQNWLLIIRTILFFYLISFLKHSLHYFFLLFDLMLQAFKS
jgi:hypothetical protein